MTNHAQPPPSSARRLVLGSRGSHLALAQTEMVRARLPGEVELRIIKTSGDQFTDKALHDQPGVGLFTKEIEEELLSRHIDVAVHSLKDLPVKVAPGLVLAAILERELPSDLLLVRPDALDESQPFPVRAGARIGTSSLRRRALAAAQRPDLVHVNLRGNVPTRIDKARRGDADAIIMARAGIKRLALSVEPLVAFDLNPELWVCAPGQGAIAVEVRADDAEAVARVATLDHRDSRACVEAERDLLLAYGGGCHSPFGAWATSGGGMSRIIVAAPDGDSALRTSAFSAAVLEQALTPARDWIAAGLPASTAVAPAGQAWLCRRAEAWRTAT